MNNKRNEQGKGSSAQQRRGRSVRLATALALALGVTGAGWSQTAVEAGNLAAKPGAKAPATSAASARRTAPAAEDARGGMPACSGELPAPVSVNVVAGKSTLVKLPGAITMRTLADNEIVQARLLSPQTLYILGTNIGSTNMILQDTSGRCTVVDVTVGVDPEPLRGKLSQLLPNEKNIAVTSAADTLVLTGVVSDAVQVEHAMSIATAYVRYAQGSETKAQPAGGSADSGAGRQEARVINMLGVASPQQVMLEVKVAEVSKVVAEKLGAELQLTGRNGDWTYGILSSFLSGGSGIVGAFKDGLSKSLSIDAEKNDGLVKILAEPNVMAISGQEGSFLAGGKVYLPVAQNTTGTATTITLEEKEFGVGLKFTPTVLAGGRINLKVAPEVSEFSREGIAVTAPNVAQRQILPLITTRRAATTVQLFDGQSLVIGGLIKNNQAGNIKALPVLGELPIIGALFRSSDFASDRSEVLFVVTPRLVKPVAGPVQLPTDAYVAPSRADVLLGGRLEGQAPPPAQSAPAANPSGFELK